METQKRNQRLWFTVVTQLHQTPGRHPKLPYRTDKGRKYALAVELMVKELSTYLGDDMGRDPKARKDKYQFTWKGFKDVKLSDTQKQAYEAWDAQDEELYELVATTVQAGYKFSCVYNTSNDTFIATLTGGQGSGAADGYSMSAFAPDWYNALRVLMFKHVEILAGDWTTAGGDESQRWG